MIIDKKNKQKKLLLLSVVIMAMTSAIIVTGAILLFNHSSGNAKTDYQLASFDISKTTLANQNKWEKHFKTFPLPHILLHKKNTDVKKYIFSTADCGIISHGYKNRVELFVIFNSAGKIEDVILDRNIETPNLINKMHENGFFQQWNGKENLDNIQYVTGATFSCKAVSKGVSELLKKLKNKNFFKSSKLSTHK